MDTQNNFAEQLVEQNNVRSNSESEYQDKPMRSNSVSDSGSFHEQPAVSKPKKVARKCPVVVDVIFVCMQLGLTLTFGFFSYYYDAINRPC